MLTDHTTTESPGGDRLAVWGYNARRGQSHASAFDSHVLRREELRIEWSNAMIEGQQIVYLNSYQGAYELEGQIARQLESCSGSKCMDSLQFSPLILRYRPVIALSCYLSPGAESGCGTSGCRCFGATVDGRTSLVGPTRRNQNNKSLHESGFHAFLEAIGATLAFKALVPG